MLTKKKKKKVIVLSFILFSVIPRYIVKSVIQRIQKRQTRMNKRCDFSTVTVLSKSKKFLLYLLFFFFHTLYILKFILKEVGLNESNRNEHKNIPM